MKHNRKNNLLEYNGIHTRQKIHQVTLSHVSHITLLVFR